MDLVVCLKIKHHINHEDGRERTRLVDPSPLHEKKGVRTSACVVKEDKQWT